MHALALAAVLAAVAAPHGPGTLVRATRIDAPAGAHAWRVLYRSVSVRGRPTRVSGLVVAPARRAPRGGWPVVSWAHPTVGWGDQCAPSRVARFGNLPLPPLWEQGFVVAATDYEGLGTPGEHPYLVGVSEGRGVLDAARAARRIPAAHAGRRVILYGHSQGGHAVLFAGQLAPRYAPELDVRGVIASAPASELATAVRLRRPPEYNVELVAALRAWSYVYRGIDLHRVLTHTARRGLIAVGRSCAVGGSLLYDRTLSSIVKRGWYRERPWPALLRRNSPGYARTRAPILLVQGTADTDVPPTLTRALRRRLCARHNHVVLLQYDGATHLTLPARSAADVLSWAKSRLRGDMARGDC
jgi:alpha-beta hydrolase superfamily lysophospholipase